MVGSDGSGVVYGAGEVDWMAQVRSSSCAGAARADSPGTQLARPFRLVSGRGALRSLRHPSSIILHRIRGLSHRIRRLRRHFGGPNRPRHLSTPHARLYGLQGLYLDLGRPSRRRARLDHLRDVP